MFDLIIVIVAYGLGSLSSAIIICQLLGLSDPREQGSKNPGATNVLRIAGKRAAAMVLLGDYLKGLLAVLLAKILGASTLVIALVALAVFLGHIYPLFFQFRGGKGVATALGAWCALSWQLGIAVISIWLLVALISRYSSLAALVTSICAPLLTYYVTDSVTTIAVTLMSLLLIWRHRTNIEQLLKHTESKIGGS